MAAKTNYTVATQSSDDPYPYILYKYEYYDNVPIRISVWLRYQRKWSIAIPNGYLFSKFDTLSEAFDFMISASININRLEEMYLYLSSMSEYLDYCIEKAFIRSDKSM